MSPTILAGIGSISSVAVAVSAWPRARVTALFAWRHRRLPSLTSPTTYNEWVQWRKLNDRDPRLAMMTDKLHGKSLAAERAGAAIVIPTLWQGTELPEAPPWPMPFIVKANHGCGQFVVVRKLADWRTAQRLAPRWLASRYGRWLDEWHYRAARPLLLVEPFIGPQTGLPIDYKVFVFAGRAEFIQVHLGRERNHRWIQFDRGFRQVSRATGDVIARPERIDDMFVAAERIAGATDHLRVDFYEVDGRLWFGELCLFAGSGLDRFDPVELDTTFGKFWSHAYQRVPTPDAVHGVTRDLCLDDQASIASSSTAAALR